MRNNQQTRKKQHRLDAIAIILGQGIFTLADISQALEEDHGIITRNGKRISLSTISKDLKAVDEMLLQRTIDNRKVIKVQQQNKLEYLYREAVEAWHNSKRSKRHPAGDPALHNAARNTLADMAKLWGLNDPALIDIAVAKAPLSSTDIHQAMVEVKEWENDVKVSIKAIEGKAIEID